MKKFKFAQYNFNSKSGIATFKYVVSGIEDKIDVDLNSEYIFEEKLFFDKADSFELLDYKSQQAFYRALENVFLAAGISYYKAFLPEKIEIVDIKLTKNEAEFWNIFYTEGLSEFAYKNKVNLIGKIKFPFVENFTKQAFELDLTNEVLVPVGGGKDSNVTIEALRSSDIKMKLFSVRSLKIINDCIAKADLPAIIVDRQISAKLIRLNNEGKTLNGHVPITGIISFIAIATAILNGNSAVILSNERSADEGSVGGANHQWSKSFRAEQLIADQIKNYIVNIDYFSLLRPYSELFIASKFARLNQYHDVFTSCNRAFFVDKEKRIEHWCCECDKCRFVFLLMAIFLTKEEMLKIFGKNLLNEEEQLNGYRELLGLTGHKPFECVGTIDECRTAVAQIVLRADWKNDFIVSTLIEELDIEKYLDMSVWFKPSQSNIIPTRFKNLRLFQV